MGGSAEFIIGAEVDCGDGPCGELRCVVLDPVAKALTHLVVRPGHWDGFGRLVPVALASPSEGRITLDCTLAEFEALEPAEETQFLPGPVGGWGYGPGELMAMPYFGLGGVGTGGMGMTGVPTAVAYDKVPLGEVEVRKGEHVRAADGPIGRVEGLVVDPADHRVTHVLLAEGHLWGAKQVAIPIGAVSAVDDEGIHLGLTKDAVRQLPPVEVAADR